MKESVLHTAVASYLSTTLAPEVFWTTFPAGYGKGVIMGARLKRCGLKAGVPDLLLAHMGKLYFIELKNETGRLSTEQRGCHLDLAIAGVPVATCRSLDDIQIWVKAWKLPTRVAA